MASVSTVAQRKDADSCKSQHLAITKQRSTSLVPARAVSCRWVTALDLRVKPAATARSELCRELLLLIPVTLFMLRSLQRVSSMA
jgi:hypothetical protein